MGNYKISGWIWLILGAIVSGYSQIVMMKAKNNMLLFFYVGLVFIGIGVAKILIKVILKNPKNRKKDLELPKESKSSSYKIIFCPRCKSKNYDSFNYCQSCGYKLK